MRERRYISPSQAGLFYSDREAYYLKYLADHKPPDFKQTAPMAVGGAFDSHVTRALAVRYFGRSDPRCAAGAEYDLEIMLDSAIQNPELDRAELTRIGLELFKRYMATGAYGRLCAELDAADKGSITMQSTLYYNAPKGLTLMGLPDIAFKRAGIQHVYDFKVNGFFSQASPLKNHVWKGVGSAETVHKGAVLGKHSCGTVIDLSGVFDDNYKRQTSTYAWSLLGGHALEPIVVGIEQVACRPASSRWKDPVVIRPTGEQVAVSNVSTRSLISVDTQAAVMAEYTHMWDCITSGWVFDDLTREESDAECFRLESIAKGLATDIDEDFNALCGR